jgi:hypothetical protein
MTRGKFNTRMNSASSAKCTSGSNRKDGQTPWRFLLMSALGQKQTFAGSKPTSALPPKADIRVMHRHVCFGPNPDITAGWKSAGVKSA